MKFLGILTALLSVGLLTYQGAMLLFSQNAWQSSDFLLMSSLLSVISTALIALGSFNGKNS